MHYYKVPRLGSYMAVTLEYNSCLSQKALDQSIIDYQNYLKSVDELEKAKKEWDEENERIREEKEKLGEPFIPEERTWPNISEKPYLTKVRKYVVCLDTLGQDRELTDEQRKFVLETVMNYSDIWERREIENLTRDRNLRLQMTDLDKEYLENLNNKLQEEEEDYIKDHINQISTAPAPPNTAVNVEGAEPERAKTPPLPHPYINMDDEQRDFYQR